MVRPVRDHPPTAALFRKTRPPFGISHLRVYFIFVLVYNNNNNTITITTSANRSNDRVEAKQGKCCNASGRKQRCR